jgi:hypothetical protein
MRNAIRARLALALILGIGITGPLAGPAAAADFDAAALQPGSVVRWNTDNGRTSVRMTGAEDGVLLWEFRRDASKGQPARLSLRTDRRGETLSVADATGVTRFDPGDCSLTIGTCRYVMTTPDGTRQKMVWTAKVDGGGVWTYALYRDRADKANLVERGRFTVDAYGFYIDRTYQGADGRKRWSKRVE